MSLQIIIAHLANQSRNSDLDNENLLESEDVQKFVALITLAGLVDNNCRQLADSLRPLDAAQVAGIYRNLLKQECQDIRPIKRLLNNLLEAFEWANELEDDEPEELEENEEEENLLEVNE